MSKLGKEPDDFDETELIRSEFDSIVAGLSLDESTPSTYLEELERIDREGFIQPNPPGQSGLGLFRSAKLSIKRWFNRDFPEDDGARV